MDKKGMRRRLAMMLRDCPVTIKRVPPITTARRRLLSLKAFGGTEQNGTPTPDAPMDIVSNNGVLKARHQSGLPLGYTRLEYLQSDGASYLLVPYRVNNKTVFYCRHNEIQKGPQIASVIFGVTSAPTASQANYGIARLLNGTGNFNRMGWGDSVVGSVINVSAPQNLDTWYEVLYNQNKLYQDNVLYATSATPNDTEWVADYDLGIFARNSTPVTMPAVAKISSVWAKEDGEYKVNLVPAKRNSDNVLGMYDLVSGQFFTNAGAGDFTAGDPVSDPVEIYTDGLQETIAIKDDQSAIVSTAVAEMLLKVGDYQDVQSILDGVVTRNVGVKVFDGTETGWSAFTSVIPDSVECYRIQFVGCVSANIKQFDMASTHFMSRGWSTGFNKLAVGDFKRGGSTTWMYFCVDASIDTVDKFKAYLADQYAAGTPVIIVYPLATPTTESVTPQTLAIQPGTNVFEITQASLNNLELEVKAR